MKKFSIFFLFYFISFACSFSQNTAIDSLLSFAEKSNNDTARIVSYRKVAKLYESVDRTKSFEYIKKALLLAELLRYNDEQGRCLNFLGDLYWFSGDFAASSDNYFKALKVYQESKNESGIADCYRNIGWIYQGQKNYNLTVEYYLKSLEINERLGNKREIIANYDDLGIVHKFKKEYAKALEYTQKTIELAKELKTKKGIGSGYGNLASIYFEMGKFDLAIENFESSNKIHLNNNDFYNYSEGCNGIADCYFQLKKYDKVIEYATIALKVAKENRFLTVSATAHYLLSKAYSARNEFTIAYEHLQYFSELQDSIYNEKNSRQINEMSAKYESEKKELMINSLETEKALTDEKLAQEKRFKIYLLLFCTAIIVFLFFLYKSNLQKKKANHKLSNAYKEIETKNKEIQDSINYAKRIQEAMLPEVSLLQNYFPEGFGLYMPKDVVSGDFYWFNELNGIVYFAVADCTGHGVPGAFMSMIGIDKLNQSLIDKKIEKPGDILSNMNVSIKNALKQNNIQAGSKDGMDIVLCSYDKTTKVLNFSGANRPLWIVRDNQVIEYKPDKLSIAGYTEYNQTFTNHLIQLQQGDIIYAFTDGIVDQFGGPDGKKFMSKRLKELLLQIHQLPMSTQELKLKSAVEGWQGNLEQIDDILVVGMRV